MNKTLIIIVVLIVIVGGYFFLRGGYQTPGPVVPKVTTPEGEIPPETAPEAQEVTVIGTEFSFSPSSITVKAGQRVKITFQNQGGAPHNLIIEGLGIGTKTIGGGKNDTIEFTAPTPGTYSIFCSIPGHRLSGMKGSLKVE